MPQTPSPIKELSTQDLTAENLPLLDMNAELNHVMDRLAKKVAKLRRSHATNIVEYKKAYTAAEQLYLKLASHLIQYTNNELDAIAFSALSQIHIRLTEPILSNQRDRGWLKWGEYLKQVLNRFLNTYFGFEKTFENELDDFKDEIDILNKKLYLDHHIHHPDQLVPLYQENKAVISACYAISPGSIKSASPAVIEQLIQDRVISPNDAVQALSDNAAFLKIRILNTQEFIVNSEDDVIQLMNEGLINPHVIVKKYPENRAIIRAAFRRDPLSIQYAKVETLNHLAAEEVITVEDVLTAFSKNRPTATELANTQAEFQEAKLRSNYKKLAFICNKFWFEKPADATIEQITATLKHKQDLDGLYLFGQATNPTRYQVTYGPLNKSRETIQLEQLARKMMQMESFKKEYIDGNLYFIFDNHPTPFNWTNIREKADLQHIELADDDLLLYMDFITRLAAQVGPISTLKESQINTYQDKLYSGANRIARNKMISFAEMHAINLYSRESYVDVNQLMRSDKYVDTRAPDSIRWALILSVMCASGLRKLPCSDIKITFRGEVYRNTEDPMQQVEAAIKQGIFDFRGFVSSSLMPTGSFSSFPIQYEFHHLRGAIISPIASDPNEQEFLIPPTQVQIRDYKKVNGQHKFSVSMVSELGSKDGPSFQRQFIKDLGFLSFVAPELIARFIHDDIISPAQALEILPNNRQIAFACFQKNQVATILLAKSTVIKDLLDQGALLFDRFTLAIILYEYPEKFKELQDTQTIPPKNMVLAAPDNPEVIAEAYKIDQSVIQFASPDALLQLLDVIPIESIVRTFPDDVNTVIKAYQHDPSLIQWGSKKIIIQLIGKPIEPKHITEVFPTDKELILAAFKVDKTSVKYASEDTIVELLNEGELLPDYVVYYFKGSAKILAALYIIKPDSIQSASESAIVSLMQQGIIPLEILIKQFPYNENIAEAAYAKDKTSIQWMLAETIINLMNKGLIPPEEVIIACPDDPSIIDKAHQIQAGRISAAQNKHSLFSVATDNRATPAITQQEIKARV